MKPSIFDLTHEDLKVVLKENGFSPFGATQIFDWVYRKWVFDPAEWSNVSKASREFLAENYDMSLLKIVWNGLSKDGTRKFLVKMVDGQTVETVAIPARERLTLCVSSQVGCAVGCTFCHTATQGLKRHLKPGEVVGQYVAVQDWLNKNVSAEEKLTNIVYMGQGEPLHNYENMKKATQIFMQENGLGLGQRRITLSTSGLVPAIEKLATDLCTHAQPALAGDRMYFRRLETFRGVKADNYMREMKLRQVRSEAEKAWQNRQYDRVVSLYGAVEGDLTESETRKLEYARQH